jgi:hypothetical protein
MMINYRAGQNIPKRLTTLFYVLLSARGLAEIQYSSTVTRVKVGAQIGVFVTQHHRRRRRVTFSSNSQLICGMPFPFSYLLILAPRPRVFSPTLFKEEKKEVLCGWILFFFL